MNAKVKSPIGIHCEKLSNSPDWAEIVYFASPGDRFTNLSPTDLLCRIEESWGVLLPSKKIILSLTKDQVEEYDAFIRELCIFCEGVYLKIGDSAPISTDSRLSLDFEF